MPANLLRRRTWLAPAVALVMTLGACDDSVDANGPAAAETTAQLSAELTPPTPTTAKVDYVHDLSAPFLPAYNARRFGPNKGKNILQPLKGDQFDDIRAAYVENYAITAPPSGNFRAMVEWEPMQVHRHGLLDGPDRQLNYDNSHRDLRRDRHERRRPSPTCGSSSTRRTPRTSLNAAA